MTHVALFTPVSPMRSGLVEHIEGLLPLLTTHLDITVVTDGSYQPTHVLFQPNCTNAIPWITYEAFRQRADSFDLMIYQLGNEARVHGYMFDALHRYPGVIFLHDLCLHHAILGLTLDRGDPDAYVAEMRYSYGSEGEAVARQVISGQGNDILAQYPLIERVLDSSLALVGFNRYMCRRIQNLRPDLPVHYAPLQFHLPEGFAKDFDGAAFRRELGLADVPVMATFGLYNPYNRLHITLRAFRRLLERHPNAVYLMVGAPGHKQELLNRISALGLTRNVRLTGYVSDEDFIKYMHVADVAVQLRYPHAGGTNYPPILLMGLGVATIISNIEPMADIPANALLRVPPGALDEDVQLFATIDHLLTHRDALAALGSSGQRYVQAHHDRATIASDIAEMIREIAAHREELVERVKRTTAAPATPTACSSPITRAAGVALAELGVASNNGALLRPIAQAIADLV